MLINSIRKKVRDDLESPPELRRLGSGWISGVAATMASLAGLFTVLCLRYPEALTVPAIREHFDHAWFRISLHFLLILAFILSALSMSLRKNKVLGMAAMCVTLLATILGGSHVKPSAGELSNGMFLGLDWFMLNLIFTGLLFAPLERLHPHRSEQSLFREEWREDVFYFLISSLLVQALSFISMVPANTILSHASSFSNFRAWVGNQPGIIQFFEIMFLTDLVQYWVHRAFHRVPFLWGFHAVHHSAQHLDWIAGARMHFFEILALRGTTIIPMYCLGFTPAAMYAYILMVYIHSTFIHANLGWNLDWLGRFFVTPRFHHWHHGIDREAIDVNFAIHFPLLDKMFGTHHLPPGQWPSGYGVEGHPVPKSYMRQFFYPFLRRKN